jgi:ABC-type Fe3+-hydroxamate transport system substrate-binding protein
MKQQVVDMMGQHIEVPVHPQRIVSLVPSQTELLADLDLEQEVVGITKFCIHPQRWFRNKARIGGTKTIHIDQVAALKPDLIIANKEENERSQIEALQAFAPVWVSDIHTLVDATDMVRKLGSICSRVEQADKIAKTIEQGINTLILRPARVAYCIWRQPWMWAGGDTFIHDMLLHCGWTNVLVESKRYPDISLEALALHKPDFVLLSSEPYPFREKHIQEVQAAIPAARILLVDGEMFSWYGSRLLKAPEYLSALLHSL